MLSGCSISFDSADASLDVVLPAGGVRRRALLGASFVYGSLADTSFYTASPPSRTAARLRRRFRFPGRTLAGISDEPLDDSLADVVRSLETSGLAVLGRARDTRMRDIGGTMQADQYEGGRASGRGAARRSLTIPASRHERYKRTYLRHGREYLGWAIFIGWKPDDAP